MEKELKSTKLILLANEILEDYNITIDKPKVILAMVEFARIILESNEKNTKK